MGQKGWNINRPGPRQYYPGIYNLTCRLEDRNDHDLLGDTEVPLPMN